MITVRHSAFAALTVMVVLLAGGVERLSVGIEKLRALRETQLRKYILALDSVSYDRLPSINPGLLQLARTGGLSTEAQPA